MKHTKMRIRMVGGAMADIFKIPPARNSAVIRIHSPSSIIAMKTVLISARLVMILSEFDTLESLFLQRNTLFLLIHFNLQIKLIETCSLYIHFIKVNKDNYIKHLLHLNLTMPNI